MSKSKVLFILTGSIACYKACQVISRLVQADCEVQVVASPSAMQFVGNATFEGLTGKSTVSDLYARGNVMDHIHFMRWADLVIVAPATANYINKIAQGVGDDLLTTLFLAHDFKKPFLIAPAMNTSMYLHPITQNSIHKLKEIGIEILETASGVLACGETGFGKLLEPDLLLREIQTRLPRPTDAPFAGPSLQATTGEITQRPFRVLVTAGGTVEPLDDVRVISNLSSGETGARIAEGIADFGAEVHLHRAENGTVADGRVALQTTFSTFASLQVSLKKLLSENDFELVVHVAAVSDFSIESFELNGNRFFPSEVRKIASSDKLTIHFKNNPKLVDQIKLQSRNPQVRLVAFKLTSHATGPEKDAAVEKLQRSSRADFVVHNDTSEIDKSARHHSFTLYGKDFIQTPLENIQSLVAEIVQNYMKETL